MDMQANFLRTPERPPPQDSGGRKYLKSYLLQRLVVGCLGLFLPLALVLLSSWFAGGIQGSLSAYYHTNLGPVFVGGLCVVGVFLITYMVFERNLDNVLSVIAGAAAIVVALVPTTAPAGKQCSDIGCGVPWVHFPAAFVFVGSLGIMSLLFGVREGSRPDRTESKQRTWRAFHFTCAGVIAASFIFMGLTFKTYEYSLLIGESAAVLAFGASWTAKGSELRKYLS